MKNQHHPHVFIVFLRGQYVLGIQFDSLYAHIISCFKQKNYYACKQRFDQDDRCQ